MSYHVRFLRAAEHDYDQAVDWYLSQAPHQVEQFVAAVGSTVSAIAARPLLPRPAHRDLRQVRTHLFPYHLWYRVFEEAEFIEVVAVLHSARDRVRWDQR